MQGLPRYIALKSATTKKYLRYVHEDVQLHGYLQLTGDEAISPYTKYELVPATNGANKGLVHVRSSYNNKFWTRVSGNDNVWWLVASADEPVEDPTQWSCTLFEPSGLLDALRLRHVQLDRYVSIYTKNAGYDSCLIADTEWRNIAAVNGDVFTVVDLESIRILPKKVVFKNEETGLYLRLQTADDHPYLAFDTQKTKTPTVTNEVFYTPDGSVRIKSDQNGNFWKRSSTNWIWADSTDVTASDADTLFWPVKVDGGDRNNKVVLRNLGNNNICKRYTAEGKTSCYNAANPDVSIWAITKIEEPVLSRTIDNIQYRLRDARIYSQTVVSIMSKEVSNPLDAAQVFHVAQTFTDERIFTWTSNASFKWDGVSTTLKTGIPLITEGAVEVLADFEGIYNWGSSVAKPETREWSDDITVPAKTTVMVYVTATRGKCDVPFSYLQADTLTSREKVTYAMNDGIYTGVNCYNFKTKVLP